MTFVLELLVSLLIVAGGSFLLIGSIGMVKLPDLLTRLHAPTKATTLGVGGALAASMVFFAGLEGTLSIHEVLITAFLVIQGIHFALLVTQFAGQVDLTEGGPVQAFFGKTMLLYLPLLFTCPLLTMRLFAEERRSGTIEALLTAPVSSTGVVLGKYAAALSTYVLMWAPTLLYIVLIGRSGDVDWRSVGASYLGLFGIGAGYLSLGIMSSALTQSQLAAAMLSAMIIIALFTLGLGEFAFDGGPARASKAHRGLRAGRAGRGPVEGQVREVEGAVVFVEHHLEARPAPPRLLRVHLARHLHPDGAGARRVALAAHLEGQPRVAPGRGRVRIEVDVAVLLRKRADEDDILAALLHIDEVVGAQALRQLEDALRRRLGALHHAEHAERLPLLRVGGLRRFLLSALVMPADVPTLEVCAVDRERFPRQTEHLRLGEPLRRHVEHFVDPLERDERAERAQGRAPAFARELFRWLRDSLAEGDASGTARGAAGARAHGRRRAHGLPGWRVAGDRAAIAGAGPPVAARRPVSVQGAGRHFGRSLERSLPRWTGGRRDGRL